jgi:hypothetical protein
MTAAAPVDAAVALGAAHGIATDDPRVLKDGSNLLVHLRPAPVVIRVATFTARIRRDPLPYLEREVRLATALVEEGAPVAPPSPLLPAGPHVIGGWAMTAWAYVDHVAGAAPDAAASFAALEALHDAMRRIETDVIEIDLPLLGPAMADLDLAIAFAVEHGLIAVEDAAKRRARRDRLAAELLAAAVDRQPLHGDAFPQNSLVTGGGVVWIDLEDCCLGPAAWDHAVLLRRAPDATVERILRQRDGDRAIELATALREVQADVWTILHDARRDGRLDAPA